MPPNPFDYHRPAVAERFVGHGALVRDTVADLLSGSNSFAILGGRRCGKSSVLRAVHDELLRRRAGTQSGEHFAIPVLMSLHQLNDAQRESAGGVHRRPGEELRGVLERDPWWRAERLPVPVQGNRAEAFDDLVVMVATAVAAANDSGFSVRVVFLVDELTCALGRSWTETFFENLRHLVYDSPVTDDLALVVAGTPRCLDAQERGSPLFNALETLDLDPLDEPSLRGLAAAAQGLDAAAVAAVLGACGGSPYLAQYLLHQMTRHAQRTFEAQLDHARRERDRELMSWWMGIGATGRRLYRELARDTRWRTTDDLAVALGASIGEMERALRLLRLHHAIRSRADGAEHRADGELFRAWVAVQGTVGGNALDRRAIVRALLDAFTSVPDWRWLVRLASERNLDEIAVGNLAEIAAAVVERAAGEAWLDRLLEVALEERPGVASLRALSASL